MTTVPANALQSQFEAGLLGLSLLRSWPFADRETVERELAAIAAIAGDRHEFALDRLDLDAGYAAWSQTYDTNPNPLLLAEEPAVAALLANVRPGVALDAACGTGRHTARLIAAGHRVIGVDRSEAMLQRARSAATGAEFRTGELGSLPVDDGSIDLALCCLALTHCPSVGEPLRDLARTLRPGGRLVVSDVHPVAVVTGAHAFFHREDRSRAVIRNEVHWHSAYLEAFEEAGLAVRHCLEPAFTPAILEAFLAKVSPAKNMGPPDAELARN